MVGGVKQTRRSSHTHAALKNFVFFVMVVCGDTLGNLLLALSMNRTSIPAATPVLQHVLSALSNPRLLGGTALLTLALFSRLSLYTWADLTYVLPVTASGYVITALLSKFVLHEYISNKRWIGVVLISLGVMIVTRTPVDTKHIKGDARQ
jgi:drug/metabolite transporter (DMT)-like permease